MRLPAAPAHSAVKLVAPKGEPRVDSRLLAERLGDQHKNVLEIIDRYKDQFKRFGKVAFEMEPLPSSQKTQFALLNEDQSYFLLSLARNTDHVVDLKANLVMAFSEARKALNAEAEYLPSYHALHDKIHALATDSSNEKFVHMNFNKLINKTIGVASGERRGLSVPRRSLLVVAQAAATNAIQTANDHHDGYTLAKSAMKYIEPVARQLGGASATGIA